MRVASICALPFHRWVLQSTVNAFLQQGHEVRHFVHHPAHPQDFLQHTDHRSFFADVRDFKPDLVLAADYPYDLLRNNCGAPVLATRHGIIHKGNGYAPEQDQADFIVTWSDWDHRNLDRYGITSPTRIQAGCPWFPHLDVPPAHRRSARERQAHRHGIPVHTPTILYAPSHNLHSYDVVFRASQNLPPGVHVIVRPHPVTLWRNPELPAKLDTLPNVHVQVDPAHIGPFTALLAADLLISDYSSIPYFALLVPHASLPIITLPPRTFPFPDSPEATHNPQLGHEVFDHHSLLQAIDEAIDDDPMLPFRLGLRHTIFQPALHQHEQDPPFRIASHFQSPKPHALSTPTPF